MKSSAAEDAKQFQTMVNAMDILGFSSTEKEEIFEIVAAVLHVGNVTFKQEGLFGKVNSHETLKTAAKVSLFNSARLLDVLVYCEPQVCSVTGFLAWVVFFP